MDTTNKWTVCLCPFPLPLFIINKIGSHICFLSLSWAGRFFDWPFSFNHFYSFQNICFHFKVFLFHFSVVCKGGGQIPLQYISQCFLHLGVGSALGCGISFPDLYGFFHCSLFSISSSCSQKEWHDASFLPCLLLS